MLPIYFWFYQIQSSKRISKSFFLNPIKFDDNDVQQSSITNNIVSDLP